MKKIIITTAIVLGFSISSNAQFGGLLNKAKNAATSKAKEKVVSKTNQTAEKMSVQNMGSIASSTNTAGMEGTWKVEGVICNTEIPELKNQLIEQEKQYNDMYKGYNWVFKKDGTISITLKDPSTNKPDTGSGQYELQGEKITMLINGQPGQYDLKFEDGQMILINTTAVNTLYYVFVKG